MPTARRPSCAGSSCRGDVGACHSQLAPPRRRPAGSARSPCRHASASSAAHVQRMVASCREYTGIRRASLADLEPAVPRLVQSWYNLARHGEARRGPCLTFLPSTCAICRGALAVERAAAPGSARPAGVGSSRTPARSARCAASPEVAAAEDRAWRAGQRRRRGAPPPASGPTRARCATSCSCSRGAGATSSRAPLGGAPRRTPSGGQAGRAPSAVVAGADEVAAAAAARVTTRPSCSAAPLARDLERSVRARAAPPRPGPQVGRGRGERLRLSAAAFAACAGRSRARCCSSTTCSPPAPPPPRARALCAAPAPTRSTS